MNAISKKYDLEERCLKYAKRINVLVNNLSKTISNLENWKQLVRSAWSVWANYIEANEWLSKKDFLMRIRISKKEAKESLFWLKLIEVNKTFIDEYSNLIQETIELMKIFGSIIEKFRN